MCRATTLIVNFGGGAVPAPGPEGAEEASLRETLERVRLEVDEAMEEFAFQRALGAIWEFIGRVNRYVDAAAPWTLAKEAGQAQRLGTVLHALGESLRCLGILLDPFLPAAAGKIRAALGAPAPRLDDLQWGRLAAGTRVQKAPGLFPRVEVKTSVAPPAGGAAGAGTSPQRITLDDFKKVDLRVAEVVAAEKVARSRKLLKLTVKLGEETRTLVAGIAEHYAPEGLVGRKVVVVANLEPATLMGVESNGMVLAGSTEATVSLLMPDQDLPPGSRVK